MLKVVPSLAKVRDITSALRRRASGRDIRGDSTVIDLRAYRDAKIIRFPRTNGPTTVA
ncbi:hypothetical protein [Herbidospora mongoliensis]|uniref:hypothetical protein n=1 Tax=Herbidospora mongoliensis TaxID=688067 RepID=UPI000A998791|nr:hypothetical protein [Herbidospora mongoliensis]